MSFQTKPYIPAAVFEPGDRVGRLVIVEELAERVNRKRLYRVRCDCGKEKKVRSSDLRKIKACGCARVGRPRPKPPTPAELALITIMRADAQHEPWELT
jgi:hypothetical protein